MNLMRRLLVVAALGMVLGMNSLIGAERFWVGTYTKNTGSEGIYTGTLDGATGELSAITLAGEAVNPSYLAVSPDGRFVYSAMEDGGGAVGAWRVGEDGALTLLNEQSSGGGGACFVSVDASGRWVFVANYGGGSVAVFPVEANGSLGERADFRQFEGSGPNPRRQKQAHAHSIMPDAASGTVVICDLGTDRVRRLAFDSETGKFGEVADDDAAVPPGGGPRHAALGPGGRSLFVANELGLSVSAFARDPATGALTLTQTVPTHEGQPDGVSLAAIFAEPRGKFLYVTSRGDDQIFVFAVAADGSLELVEKVAAGVETPRGMRIDPSGRWLVVGGQGDGRLVTHAIDAETGRLSDGGGAVSVPGPVDVVFVVDG